LTFNVCVQILNDVGEFENPDIDRHERAANQLNLIWRYQQRAIARHRKALCAFYDAIAST